VDAGVDPAVWKVLLLERVARPAEIPAGTATATAAYQNFLLFRKWSFEFASAGLGTARSKTDSATAAPMVSSFTCGLLFYFLLFAFSPLLWVRSLLRARSAPQSHGERPQISHGMRRLRGSRSRSRIQFGIIGRDSFPKRDSRTRIPRRP
jgi:hypothetical protein